MTSACESLRWEQDDGTSLHVHAWHVADPVAAVLVLHGLSEHAGRYADVAAALNAAGYSVFAPDLRGHGRSAASPEDLGLWAERDGFERVLRDVDDAQGRIQALLPNRPLALLGHSGGSFLALAHAQRRSASIAALALSGSAGPAGLRGRLGRLVALRERRRLGARGRSELLDRLSFGHFNDAFEPIRTPSDWLSRDASRVDEYLADPLCGVPSTTQLWVDLLGALRRLHRPRALRQLAPRLPIYVFSGDRDPVGEQGRGVARLVALLRAAGCEGVTQRLYPNARHELFHEVNRNEVLRDLQAWFAGALER